MCERLSPLPPVFPGRPGDYLVTIEDKNSATYLRAYTNWRYQVIQTTPAQTDSQSHQCIDGVAIPQVIEHP